MVSLRPFALSVLLAAAAQAVEVRSNGDKVELSRGQLKVILDPSGRGSLSSASVAGNAACKPRPAGGVFASLILPEGHPLPLQPIAGREVSGQVVVRSVRVTKGAKAPGVETAGTVNFPGLGQAAFTVHARMPESGPALALSLELSLPTAARKGFLSALGLAIPLALDFHPTSAIRSKVDRNRAAAAILPRAGTPIPEVRWLVAKQDDQSVWGPMLWTLAGVRHLTPMSFEVWERWGRLNPEFVLQHHNRHPGWMAAADGRAAVAAAMSTMADAAPTEIYVDAVAGVLNICFQSPHLRPLPLAMAPQTLRAGPAYLFIEAAEENARRPEAYRGGQTAPALARIGSLVSSLPPTRCNFSPKIKVRRTAVRDLAPLPSDPEFVSHEPGPKDEITIWVDETAGSDFPSFPLTRGVPLARGVLRDATRVSLHNPEGRPLPCVARPAAFWPDRSIKWLLVDFQAPLRANAGAKLKLLVGKKARPTLPPAPLKATATAGSVAVETGRLRALFANDNGRLALSLGFDINGDGAIAQDETVVEPVAQLATCVFAHTPDSSAYPSGSWLEPGAADPGVARLVELRVEESNPLRAVVLARLDLAHGLVASTIDQKLRPRCGTPVTLRFHFFAGSPLVLVQHTFMFCGDVNHDFLRELALRLPVAEGPGQQVTVALDSPLTVPRQGALGVLQENPDSAFAWRATADRAEVLARATAARGWLDLSGPRWGVAVGIRHMRETFPKELHVARDGIRVHFWPPRVRPMDVRRYAFKYGSGESSSTGWGTAFGAMRTHEVVWCFHRADGRQEAIAAVRAMLRPPLPRIRPRYVADTLAVGHVAEWGAPTNDAHMDAVLYHMPRMHQHNRQFWRWMGFWNFGDEIQVYNAHRQRWDRDEGRYGWYNNEPLRDYNYHLAFLMTGNRRIWEQAAAMSRHVVEVDIRHANPQPFMGANANFAKQRYSHSTTNGVDFCGRRHNCQHWADGYWGRRVGSPPGFRLAYYQSGDPTMREYLQRILAAAMATHRSQYMHADSDEALLWAMLTGYEMTLDQKYLDRIKGYVKLQVRFARKHNGLPAAQANWDWATNTPGAEPRDPRDDLWIWSFGGHLALIEAADVFGDAALDQMLRNWVLTLEGAGPDGKKRTRWSNNVGACPLLSYYYRRTGEPRALEWFKERLRRFHSAIPKDAPTDDLPTREMDDTLPAYTPHDGYGWVYCTSSFWYVGIPAWQGALRARQ